MLYGFKPKEFLDYKSNEKLNESEDIYNKSLQLKNPLENTRNNCLANIEKAQEKQKNYSKQ